VGADAEKPEHQDQRGRAEAGLVLAAKTERQHEFADAAMMRPLLRAYDWLTAALAVVAGIMMVTIFAGVIADVTIRDLGYQSPRAIQPLAEFGLLYITLLGSPWVLRSKGMIIIESLRLVLPAVVRRVLEVMVYFICAAICGTLAWYAMSQAILSWNTNEADQRAITIPLYYAYAPMFIGFFLMGCEFLRLLFSRDTIYGQSATEQEGI
jgi:C4-dicarboxylate transporter, DctQ subunit